MDYRIEKDSMGEMQVPADRYWAAQTQRSFENFRIGTETMPLGIIRAFAVLKKAAALTNCRLGKLDEERCGALAAVCDEIDDLVDRDTWFDGHPKKLLSALTRYSVSFAPAVSKLECIAS